MAVASGPAGPVLAGPLFHSNKKKKVPSWLPSVLYGMAEKVIEVQYSLSSCFHQSTRLETRYSGETRPTHGMETGLTRAALLASSSGRDGDGLATY